MSCVPPSGRRFAHAFAGWSFLLVGFLQTQISGAELAIQSPQEFQVFQRNDRNTGTFRLHGRSSIEAEQWEYRVVGQSLDGNALPEKWVEFPAALQKGGFNFVATAPAGGWYRLEVRALNGGTLATSSSVGSFGIGEVFIVAGQSNAANYGSVLQHPQSGRLSAFDGKTWGLADDPQRGASGKGGSFMPVFGDAIVKRFNVPVGIVPTAVGSTSVREWLPEGTAFDQQTTTGKGVIPTADGKFTSDGKLYGSLCSRVDALGNRGARAVLWHQGESDAGQARGGYPAERQISGEQYFVFLKTLVHSLSAYAGWSLPWISAQTTYHTESDPSDAEFRLAQQRAWESGLTLQGPDTDTLRAEYRTGVHFNGAGLQKHGEMWAEKVGKLIDSGVGGQPLNGPPTTDYKLVWSDEFDGPTLDTAKWKHRYLGPRKDGVNDTSAIALDGAGHLLITCSRKDDKILTGMICTDSLFSAKYGYFEARVQFQTQEGWWPGFWLMGNRVGDPDRGKATIDDTERNGTEIDIFEYLRIRGDQLQHALHWNGYGPNHKSVGHHPSAANLTSGFHTVGCEWTPERYVFYVDGMKSWETTSSISGVEEYIILSGEVSSWPGNIQRASLPDSVVFDYVRVWQK